MPFIEASDGKYRVFAARGGLMLAEYETQDEAEAHAKSLESPPRTPAPEPETPPTIDGETLIRYGGRVKALGDGIIEGLLITFTDADIRDLHGEYFNADTDLWTDRGYPVESARVLYNHGLDDTMKVKSIGRIIKAAIQDVGVWVQAQLDMADEYERYIYELVKQGKLGWSSGALPQSVQVDTKTGHIKSWAVIEGSLTPQPAMPFTTRIMPAKSLSQGETLSALMAKDPVEDKEPSAEPELPVTPIIESETRPLTGAKSIMNNDALEKLAAMLLSVAGEIQSALAAEGDMASDDAERMSEEIVDDVRAAAEEELEDVRAEDDDEIEAAMQKAINKHLSKAIEKALAKRRKQADAAKTAVSDAFRKAAQNTGAKSTVSSYSNGTEHAPRIQVSGKYADWSPEDMSFAAMLQAQSRTSGKAINLSVDGQFLREFADKTEKAIASGKFRATAKMVKGLQAIKANEIDHTSNTGFGEEWVPELWANDVWEKARLDNVVLANLRMIDMPSNPYKYPVEAGDPTVSYVPETTDEDTLALDISTSPIPDSRVGTANVTFDAKKLATRIGISAELEEDGIARLVPEFRRQTLRSLEDAIDNVLLNGDTAASGNINLDGGTPGANLKYKAFNGLIKNALVTNTTNAVDAGGATVTLSMIRNTRFKLSAANASRPNDLMYVCDNETYSKLLSLDEFITLDKAGPLATNATGLIGFIDGSPVFVSAELALADSDGKITSGGNVVDRGRLVVIHKPSAYVGFRRRVQSSMTFLPYYDIWQLVATTRADLQIRDNDSVSILYNIGV